jgi:hypothetical protein
MISKSILERLQADINGIASIMRAKIAERPASLAIELTEDNVAAVAKQVGRALLT